MPFDRQLHDPSAGNAQFTTTQWSVVLSARDSTPETAQGALERLCQAYWPPIYTFLRRKGNSPADAKDLAQEFFLRLLRRETFADADPRRGRFRTFLLSALSCFLTDEHRRSTRQKRGGGEQPLSLDEGTEEGYLEPASPGLAPDQLYDRRWRLVLLQHALHRLETEFIAADKQRHFTLLKEFLTAPANIGAYAPIAAELGTSSRTLAVTIHRMRQRFRELVREELAHTVTNAAEFEDELKLLFG